MRDRGNPYDEPAFVARYARSRPGPPPDLLSFLVERCGRDPPTLVVDLGCGTGLSTVAWSGRATRVVGVESNPNMLRRARRAAGVEYREAPASATGVERGAADIVTCCQSFHWMKPRETVREVARILRSGGVFSTYDYALPPRIDPEVDTAFASLLRWSGLPGLPDQRSMHRANLVRSGKFRWIGEGSFHRIDRGDARRVTDLALSLAHVSARLGGGAESREPHFQKLRRVAERAVGTSHRRFWWTFEALVAVRK